MVWMQPLMFQIISDVNSIYSSVNVTHTFYWLATAMFPLSLASLIFKSYYISVQILLPGVISLLFLWSEAFFLRLSNRNRFLKMMLYLLCFEQLAIYMSQFSPGMRHSIGSRTPLSCFQGSECFYQHPTIWWFANTSMILYSASFCRPALLWLPLSSIDYAHTTLITVKEVSIFNRVLL